MNSVSALQRAPSIEALLISPVGKYFVGDTFLYFYPAQRLNGFALWGCPSACDIRQLNHAMDSVLTSAGGAHVSLIDASGLVAVDAAAFATMAGYLSLRWSAFKNVICKQALVRPAGLAGAIVAGFYDVLTPSYPTAVFAEIEPGLEWLGVQEPGVTQRLLQQLIDKESGTEPLLDQLQRLLEASRGERLQLTRAASALGVSERTLQRRLRAAHTTFQLEVQKAQVRLAKHLMLESRLSLTAIAFEVGCSTLPHFSSLFRKATGVTPSLWRAGGDHEFPAHAEQHGTYDDKLGL